MTSPKAWSLDAAGQLLETSSYTADVKFEYDYAGHMTKESDTNYIYGGGCTNVTTIREDGDGNVSSMTYPAGDVPYFSFQLPGLNPPSLDGQL